MARRRLLHSDVCLLFVVPTLEGHRDLDPIEVVGPAAPVAVVVAAPVTIAPIVTV